jgi:hypothetical protein
VIPFPASHLRIHASGHGAYLRRYGRRGIQSGGIENEELAREDAEGMFVYLTLL